MLGVGERPLLVRDPRFRDHALRAAHPECPERLDAIDAALVPLADRVREVEARPATDEEVLRVHHKSHLQALRDVAGQNTRLDADTYSAPRSLETGILAAGSIVDLALRVARGEARRAFAAIRPPGHHAERTHPMGFCLLNNVAIAARALQAEAGIERVAILDWDVHHGNGTQHSFENERDVLFASTHQFPFYPGTGALSETGGGAGEGATLNVPLPAGSGDAEYGAAFDQILVPVLREFRPQVILVSAGFDAHARDPLASMQVSTAGFRCFAARVRAVADEICDGRLIVTLEGGYDLRALGESVAELIRVLASEDVPDAEFPIPSPGGTAVVNEIREAHARNWASLRA